MNVISQFYLKLRKEFLDVMKLLMCQPVILRFLGLGFKFNTHQSGMSLTEVLVAIGLSGIVATGSATLFYKAFKNSKAMKDAQERVTVGNYMLQFADCTTTMADNANQLACDSGQPINVRDKDNNIILSSTGRSFDRLAVSNVCQGGQIFLYSKYPSDLDSSKMLGGVPIICPAASPRCSGFNVQWSNTMHGSCDWQMTGQGINRVSIGDGKHTFDQNGSSGTIPCSPWDGANANLSFTAIAYDNQNRAVSCPDYNLICNGNYRQLASGGGHRQVTASFGSDGFTYQGVVYRHWLWVTVSTNASNGQRSVTIDQKNQQINVPGFHGLLLSVSSHGYYGEANSKYLSYESVNSTPVNFNLLAPAPAPSGVSIPLAWTENTGSCPACGVYMYQCTNGSSNNLSSYQVYSYFK